MDKILKKIVADTDLHARWLNTLSLMENTGARKISASEDTVNVTYIILKHAAEEHRHAFYLKKQLEKLGAGFCPTYARQYLLAPAHSKYYLNYLDVEVCRYLKSEARSQSKLFLGQVQEPNGTRKLNAGARQYGMHVESRMR